MASSPAFQFYQADFLVGTAFFTNAQRGAYITMLCFQWDKGFITEEEAAHLCRDLTDQERLAVFAKFKPTRGQLINVRLESERKKREKFCESQRKNIQKRWGKVQPTEIEEDLGIPTNITEPYHGTNSELPNTYSSSSSSSSS